MLCAHGDPQGEHPIAANGGEARVTDLWGWSHVCPDYINRDLYGWRRSPVLKPV